MLCPAGSVRGGSPGACRAMDRPLMGGLAEKGRRRAAKLLGGAIIGTLRASYSND